ncbi:ubiquinone biosynthesis protein COQ7, putative, partial [Trypanosoma cruzi]
RPLLLFSRLVAPPACFNLPLSAFVWCLPPPCRFLFCPWGCLLFIIFFFF